MRRTILQELTYELFNKILKIEIIIVEDKLEQITSQHHHVLKQC